MQNHSTRIPSFPPNLEDFAPWVATHGLYAPYGECQCGCGLDVSIAQRGRVRDGTVFGHPIRFIVGHNNSRPAEGRFWEKVDKRGPDDCWEWTASKNKGGYGLIKKDGSMISAHRVSWEMHNGPIPSGMDICHKCDNPPCCNPDHLFIGTRLDNVRDMIAKGRGNAPHGEMNPHAKLTAENVKAIRDRAQAGEARRVLANEFGVDRSIICRIINRKKWKRAP